MKYYYNDKTDEKVLEEDAQEYAMDMLGITIKPIGKHAVLSKDQIDFILEFTQWYFSGDWVLKEENEKVQEDYDAYLEDKIYEEKLDRMMMEGY